jgi:hypothetical protein
MISEWYACPPTAEEHTASIFRAKSYSSKQTSINLQLLLASSSLLAYRVYDPEDGGNPFLIEVDTFLPEYTA